MKTCVFFFFFFKKENFSLTRVYGSGDSTLMGKAHCNTFGWKYILFGHHSVSYSTHGHPYHRYTQSQSDGATLFVDQSNPQQWCSLSKYTATDFLVSECRQFWTSRFEVVFLLRRQHLGMMCFSVEYLQFSNISRTLVGFFVVMLTFEMLTEPPNLRMYAECSNHLSYQGQTFVVDCLRTIYMALPRLCIFNCIWMKSITWVNHKKKYNFRPGSSS